MSGVIDKDGVQWERCNRCAGFTEFSTLIYEEPSPDFEYGRDLCPTCTTALAFGADATLPPDQLRDQLTDAQRTHIRDQVRAGIDEHGLKVLIHNADGTVTDDSIPPKGKNK